MVGGPGVTPLSLSDPVVAAVQYPRFGAYAARVNYVPGVGVDPNRLANSLRQQSIVGAGDIDPSDGKVHARFVYLPILEDGGHVPAQQAFFYVAVRNVTKGTVVWERFAFANEAGVPWSSSGDFRYTGWQAVDASGGPGVIDIGDTLELEVIAVVVRRSAATAATSTSMPSAPASPADRSSPRRPRARCRTRC